MRGFVTGPSEWNPARQKRVVSVPVSAATGREWDPALVSRPQQTSFQSIWMDLAEQTKCQEWSWDSREGQKGEVPWADLRHR